MGTPNWGKLKEQGRCKEIGVSWSTEEAKAVSELKIPAAYVRRGCLTTEDFNEMKESDEGHLEKTGEKPLEAMDRNELLEKAEDAKVAVTPQATEEGLKSILSGLMEKKPKAKKPAKKVAKK